MFSPVLLWGVFSSAEYCKEEGVAKSAATSIAFIPVSFLCAPVVAPVAAVWCATKSNKEQCYSGDLSPESDDEIN